MIKEEAVRAQQIDVNHLQSVSVEFAPLQWSLGQRSTYSDYSELRSIFRLPPSSSTRGVFILKRGAGDIEK